jgi:hypothetical protein
VRFHFGFETRSQIGSFGVLLFVDEQVRVFRGDCGRVEDEICRVAFGGTFPPDLIVLVCEKKKMIEKERKEKGRKEKKRGGVKIGYLYEGENISKNKNHSYIVHICTYFDIMGRKKKKKCKKKNENEKEKEKEK